MLLKFEIFWKYDKVNSWHNDDKALGHVGHRMLLSATIRI